jgi:hypothetical protein
MNTEVRAKIDETRAMIARIQNYTIQVRPIVVPDIKPGFFGRISQQNRNYRNAQVKAKAEQDAIVAKYNPLIEKLKGLYDTLINTIPEETKTKLETYKFDLKPGTTEKDPYYIKKGTKRQREYGSGMPYIEEDTIIVIDDNIDKNVEDFIAWENDIEPAKVRNAKAKQDAIEKPKKDQLIIDRYVAKGYTYIPAHIETRKQNDYIAIMHGSSSYNVEISAFLKYKTKSYSDKPDWTQTTETIKHTLKEENNSPIEVQCKINIWTRTLPTGWPETIVVGSDKFYKTINIIDPPEAPKAPEAPQGGKRSKRKTLKKKKRSGKKLN